MVYQISNLMKSNFFESCDDAFIVLSALADELTRYVRHCAAFVFLFVYLTDRYSNIAYYRLVV